MSTRERWIVYPLLFLALGAALRDKIIGKIEIPQLEVKEAVKCGTLFVMGPNGQPAVLAGVVRGPATTESSRRGHPMACR